MLYAGRFDKAIMDFEQALSINPNFHDASTGLMTTKEDAAMTQQKKLRENRSSPP